jgi:hypothetical protein
VWRNDGEVTQPVLRSYTKLPDLDRPGKDQKSMTQARIAREEFWEGGKCKQWQEKEGSYESRDSRELRLDVWRRAEADASNIPKCMWNSGFLVEGRSRRLVTLFALFGKWIILHHLPWRTGRTWRRILNAAASSQAIWTLSRDATPAPPGGHRRYPWLLNPLLNLSHIGQLIRSAGGHRLAPSTPQDHRHCLAESQRIFT